MGFIPADNISLGLFVLFSMIMTILIFLTLRQAKDWRKWSFLFASLIFVFSMATILGIVQQHFIPVVPILFLLMFIFGISFSFSQSGKELSSKLSLASLIGFQSFRLPLEGILHHWAGIGTIPETMTWTGQNWDVISGIVALVTLPMLNKNRNLAIATNLIGFILLMNVIRVVVMSLPLPFAWPLEKPLLLAVFFPYVLIAPLFVLPALVGHLLTFQKFILTKA